MPDPDPDPDPGPGAEDETPLIPSAPGGAEDEAPRVTPRADDETGRL